MKHVFKRTRPRLHESSAPAPVPDRWSFPSGHTNRRLPLPSSFYALALQLAPIYGARCWGGAFQSLFMFTFRRMFWAGLA